MTDRAGPGLRAYAAAGIVAIAAALAVGRPQPALVGAVLLAFVVAELAGGPPASPSVEVSGLPESAVEGDEVGFEVTVRSDHALGRCYLDLATSGLRLVDVSAGRILDGGVIALEASSGLVAVAVTTRATGWGRARVGPVVLHTESRLGLRHGMVRSPGESAMTVVPSAPSLRAWATPAETNLHVGDLVSKRSGFGSEFADIRPYRPGDDPRWLNWRVSSRAGGWWVNDRHPERNGDVVLLVDAQGVMGADPDPVVDRVVRLGAHLLNTHVRQRHRLGLVTLDGVCRWLGPGSGEAHRRRLLEQLVRVGSGEVMWEAAERAVLRAAKSPALVVALTPLLDPHLAGLIHTLRRSGVDVATVLIDIEASLPDPADPARGLGRRLWRMERERMVERLAGEGVATALWRDGDPPEAPLALLQQWRTAWRRHA